MESWERLDYHEQILSVRSGLATECNFINQYCHFFFFHALSNVCTKQVLFSCISQLYNYSFPYPYCITFRTFSDKTNLFLGSNIFAAHVFDDIHDDFEYSIFYHFFLCSHGFFNLRNTLKYKYDAYILNHS